MDTMRQEYKPLTEEEKYKVAQVKRMAATLFIYLDGLPASRELSIAKTKLEEAVMWAVKGLT